MLSPPRRYTDLLSPAVYELGIQTRCPPSNGTYICPTRPPVWRRKSRSGPGMPKTRCTENPVPGPVYRKSRYRKSHSGPVYRKSRYRKSRSGSGIPKIPIPNIPFRVRYTENPDTKNPVPGPVYRKSRYRKSPGIRRYPTDWSPLPSRFPPYFHEITFWGWSDFGPAAGGKFWGISKGETLQKQSHLGSENLRRS